MKKVGFRASFYSLPTTFLWRWSYGHLKINGPQRRVCFIWHKVFKNGPSKIFLLGRFLNTLCHVYIRSCESWETNFAITIKTFTLDIFFLENHFMLSIWSIISLFYMYLTNLPHLLHWNVSLACLVKLFIYAHCQEKKFSMVSFTVHKHFRLLTNWYFLNNQSH